MAAVMESDKLDMDAEIVSFDISECLDVISGCSTMMEHDMSSYYSNDIDFLNILNDISTATDYSHGDQKSSQEMVNVEPATPCCIDYSISRVIDYTLNGGEGGEGVEGLPEPVYTNGSSVAHSGNNTPESAAIKDEHSPFVDALIDVEERSPDEIKVLSSTTKTRTASSRNVVPMFQQQGLISHQNSQDYQGVIDIGWSEHNVLLNKNGNLDNDATTFVLNHSYQKDENASLVACSLFSSTSQPTTCIPSPPLLLLTEAPRNRDLQVQFESISDDMMLRYSSSSQDMLCQQQQSMNSSPSSTSNGSLTDSYDCTSPPSLALLNSSSGDGYNCHQLRRFQPENSSIVYQNHIPHVNISSNTNASNYSKPQFVSQNVIISPQSTEIGTVSKTGSKYPKLSTAMSSRVVSVHPYLRNSPLDYSTQTSIPSIPVTLANNAVHGVVESDASRRSKSEFQTNESSHVSLNSMVALYKPTTAEHSKEEDSELAHRAVQLTDEEITVYNAEGYQLPKMYPLSKLEERRLKQVRRKLKNKWSAQESRRKKREYVENLEERCNSVNEENEKLKKQVHNLEHDNKKLISQLSKLQELIISFGTTTYKSLATFSGHDTITNATTNTATPATNNTGRKNNSTILMMFTLFITSFLLGGNSFGCSNVLPQSHFTSPSTSSSSNKIMRSSPSSSRHQFTTFAIDAAENHHLRNSFLLLSPLQPPRVMFTDFSPFKTYQEDMKSRVIFNTPKIPDVSEPEPPVANLGQRVASLAGPENIDQVLISVAFSQDGSWYEEDEYGHSCSASSNVIAESISATTNIVQTISSHCHINALVGNYTKEFAVTIPQISVVESLDEWEKEEDVVITTTEFNNKTCIWV